MASGSPRGMGGGRAARVFLALAALFAALGIGFCIGQDSVQRERCVVTYPGGKP